MSKSIIVIAAAIITLALFWKPLKDMLNGIIGGGSGATDYFSPRDTSTSQGPAYDPPNLSAPGGAAIEPINYTRTTTYREPVSNQENQDGFQISDKILQAMLDAAKEAKDVTSTETADNTDKKGTDSANIINEQKGGTLNDINPNDGLIGYITTPEGAVNAAFVGALVAPTIYKMGKKIVPKSLSKAKDVLPKAAEKSKALTTKAIDVFKKSPKLKAAGTAGAIIAAAAGAGYLVSGTAIKYKTGTFPTFDEYLGSVGNAWNWLKTGERKPLPGSAVSTPYYGVNSTTRNDLNAFLTPKTTTPIQTTPKTTTPIQTTPKTSTSTPQTAGVSVSNKPLTSGTVITNSGGYSVVKPAQDFSKQGGGNYSSTLAVAGQAALAGSSGSISVSQQGGATVYTQARSSGSSGSSTRSGFSW